MMRWTERLLGRAGRGMVLGLDRMQSSLAAIGDPQQGLAFVHVAGSNGKGSVCAMLESIARRAGIRTGLYTSPHLCRFAERIRIDNQPLADEAFEEALAVVFERGSPELTFFETLTAAAFHALRQQGAELSILEVGLGGRLDATNVIARPEVTAITSIALEHTSLLGTTLEQIAREKAGILKRGVPVVLGPLDPQADSAVQDVAAEAGAGPIVRVVARDAAQKDAIAVHATADHTVEVIAPSAWGTEQRVTASLGLRGPHQVLNAAVATGLAWHLQRRWPRIGETIGEGLSKASWPGRLESIDRGGVRVLLDCAHNPHGAQALAVALRGEGVEPHRTVLVFGALADKSWSEMLAILAPLGRSRVYTEPKGRPAASLDALCRLSPGDCVPEPAQAIERALAMAAAGETVLVTGSIYLVGQIRGHLLDIECDPVVAL
jgi:dihydrofolate synthase/folylpolyglutamate synthase